MKHISARHRGMSLIEVMVVVVLTVGALLVLAFLLLPMLGGPRRPYPQARSGVNIRSIGTALIMYATTNGDHFPESPEDTGGAAGTEAAALKKLIEQNFFDTITLNNPIDPATLSTGVTQEDILRDGTDYWILSTDNAAYYNHSLSTVPLVADKNTGTPAAPTSLWKPAGPWQGGVFWADGHTTSEADPVVETKWPVYDENGTALKPAPSINPSDALFDGTPTDAVIEMD